jgi:GNAT superfamily N-acetyltransferase
MLLTSEDTAYQLEMAEATHLTRQIECYARLAEDTTSVALPVAGGIAALTRAELGRRFNHVAGFAMGACASTDDLRALEPWYAERGLPVEIDLCPHAHPSARDALSARHYMLRGFTSVYVCALTRLERAARREPDVEVRTAIPHNAALPCPPEIGLSSFEASEFVAQSIAVCSHAVETRSTRVVESLAEVASARSDTLLFSAWIDGVVAGTATLSLIDSPHGRVAQFRLASTLAAYRGRGVFSALLAARLAVAREAGYEVGCVTVDATQACARTIERAGFQLAYTRPTFIRYPSPRASSRAP